VYGFKLHLLMSRSPREFQILACTNLIINYKLPIRKKYNVWKAALNLNWTFFIVAICFLAKYVFSFLPSFLPFFLLFYELLRSPTSVARWSECVFLSEGNPHFTSRFCRVELGPIPNSKMNKWRCWKLLKCLIQCRRTMLTKNQVM
jgi:hypothetical protein